MKTNGRILCIDDHPASREVMKLLLIGVLGYTEARIINCSSDVVERLANSSMEFDAMLLDLNMEPLDGFELLKQFRSNPRYSRTPIVALTAATSASEVSAARSAGFNGLIGKPVDPMMFPNYIDRILKQEAVWEAG
jgi:CheY-like chemotaxis protein